MKKKRKLKVKNLIKLIMFPIMVAGLIFIFSYDGATKQEVDPIGSSKFESFFENRPLSEYILSPKETIGLDLRKLANSDYISYKNTENLESELYSYGYLIVDLENRDALYALHNSEPIYPASLTKLMTLDVVLKYYHKNLDRTSYFTYEERADLIAENASLAYLEANREYTIRDLLYGLLLPSGADAAQALANLFIADEMNLVDEMNKRAAELGLTNSNFVNASGLHDENHYMSLDDIFKVAWDVLKFEEGQKLLSSLEYTTEDSKILKSTLYALKETEEISVKGGKTGFTGQAGENIFVYYLYNEKPYALILSGAPGNPYYGETYHFDDVRTIVFELYNSDGDANS